MLLDAETFDLLPRAAEIVDAAADERFKLELPAAQLELTLPPARTVPEAIAALADARRDLAAAAAPVGRLATAGVHPFADPIGVLNEGARYAKTEAEYGVDRAATARLRAAGPRRRRRRGSLARRLQRPAAVAAARRRARRQRAVPRRPRHRARVDPPEDRRAAAAPGDAAGDRVVGGVRRRARLGRRVRRRARAAALVVGAAAASGVRDARGARAGRAGDRRGRRRGDGAGPRARRLARRSPRRGRAARDRRHLAARGEPLVGGALRAWMPSWPTSRTRRARARARAAWPRWCPSSRRSRAIWAARRSSATVARLGGHNGAARQREVGRARRPARRDASGSLTSTHPAPTTPTRAREDPPSDERAAFPPRPQHRGAVRGPARAPASPAADPAARRRRPAGRRGPPARPLPLLRAALSRPARRRRALGVVAVAARAAPGARGIASRHALRAAVGPVGPVPAAGGLRPRAAGDRRRRRRPSLSRHIEREATLEQVLEFLVHRSAYQLKEADPHSWAIARLSGAAEGRARRDPGRRVRRRAARAHARAPVRRRDGGARPRRRAMARTSTGCRP